MLRTSALPTLDLTLLPLCSRFDRSQTGALHSPRSRSYAITRSSISGRSNTGW